MASWRDRLAGLPATTPAPGLTLHDAVGFNPRRRGLAGLDALPAEVGLRFDRCRSIHTIGMRFALDLVWLDADGAVVRLDEGVPPRRLRSCRGARQVVETAAGSGRRFAEALESEGLTDSPSLHN
jgi:uncharacterized protein